MSLLIRSCSTTRFHYVGNVSARKLIYYPVLADILLRAALRTYYCFYDGETAQRIFLERVGYSRLVVSVLHPSSRNDQDHFPIRVPFLTTPLRRRFLVQIDKISELKYWTHRKNTDYEYASLIIVFSRLNLPPFLILPSLSSQKQYWEAEFNASKIEPKHRYRGIRFLIWYASEYDTHFIDLTGGICLGRAINREIKRRFTLERAKTAYFALLTNPTTDKN